MNILFSYRIYPSYGGVEVITTLLANQFINDGHAVTIASYEQGNEGILKQLDKRVDLLNLENKKFSFKNIRTLRKYCRERSIDVIINQWGLPFHTSLMFKRSVPNIPIISVLHGSPVVARTLLKTEKKVYNADNKFVSLYYKVILEIKRTVIKKGIRYNIKNNNYYVLLSESFIPVLESFVGHSYFPNLTAIGNPITIKTDFSTHSEEKDKSILYVGRMDYDNKRVDRIVDFWKRCCNKLPDWELTMVGDGPYKQTVKEATNGLPRFNLMPFQEEPPIEYFKKASVLLLTSDLEGFGLVVIEAMSYGTVPVVYGSYEAIYDIISNGKDGFITSKPFNESEFDNTVLSLCNNQQVREKMSINAVEKSQSFSMSKIKRQWYTLIEKSIKK